MEYSKSDIKTLNSWGYTKKDIDQIKVATSLIRYGYKDNLICDVKARRMPGSKVYLSGIARSAFYFSSSRETPDGEVIMFGSGALFR